MCACGQEFLTKYPSNPLIFQLLNATKGKWLGHYFVTFVFRFLGRDHIIFRIGIVKQFFL